MRKGVHPDAAEPAINMKEGGEHTAARHTPSKEKLSAVLEKGTGLWLSRMCPRLVFYILR